MKQIKYCCLLYTIIKRRKMQYLYSPEEPQPNLITPLCLQLNKKEHNIKERNVTPKTKFRNEC